MSSAHVAMWGSQSLTHRPPLPCCAHWRFDARIGESNSPIAVITRPKLGGMGLPASSWSSGFGSNVSMCDGPPSMKRKITFFALGAKCGFFGASGLMDCGAASALPFSKSSSASAPKPAPARSRKSRRVNACSRRPQNEGKLSMAQSR